MLNALLDAVTPADIQALLDNEVQESRRIEYKRELPGNSDTEKKEFLADVSSFANAGGGDLLFGVEAKDGVPSAIPGLAGFNEDPDRLRLESMIRDGIAPRIPGVHLRAIPGFSAGPVLVIRVPKSWAAPHMVTFKGSSRFHSRSSAGKFPMDVRDIRSAFEASGELTQRIERWHMDRLVRISANDVPTAVDDTAKIVVHFIPIHALSDPWRFSTEELSNRDLLFNPIGCSGLNRYANIDGFLAISPKRDGGSAEGYTQVFRSGCIESVGGNLAQDANGVRCIASVSLEDDLFSAMKHYLESLRTLGVELPIAFLMTFLGVKGAHLGVAPKFSSGRAFDRDLLRFPDVLIQNYDGNWPQVLRPVFDALWNAGGHERCYRYDSGGKWLG